MMPRTGIKNLLYCLFISVFATGCSPFSPPSEFDRLNEYFANRHQLELDDRVKGVFVLSASGCMSCNKKFARLIEAFKDKPDLVVLVTAPSSRIDHSNLQASNFYFDSRPEPFLEQSKAILLSKKSIDTILAIDAESVDRNLDYIMEKFNQL